MKFQYLCVVGADGFYRARAIVGLEQDETGEIVKRMQHAELNQGERLIDTARPNFKLYTGMQGFVRPRWDGEVWTEGATPEEIAVWDEEHPAPAPVPPDAINVLGAQVAQLSLENMQKDQIINALGAQLAQTSLDVMTLKNAGGV